MFVFVFVGFCFCFGVVVFVFFTNIDRDIFVFLPMHVLMGCVVFAENLFWVV